MDQRQLMSKMEEMLEQSKAAILATASPQGISHMRWMTPAILKWRPDSIYCFTRTDSRKIAQINVNPKVEWMIQPRTLNEIITLQGNVNIIDNPALRSEIHETLGNRLTMFWKVDMKHTDLVVLETVIQEASYYHPIKNIRHRVLYSQEAK